MRNTTGENQKLLKLLHTWQSTTINLTEASFRQNWAFETVNIFVPKIFLYPHEYLCKTTDKMC